jgi:secreted Zn-dependent insulinase-like peptidase
MKTFINIGTGSNYQVLTHEDDINIVDAYNAFITEYNMKEKYRSYDTDDYSREVIHIVGNDNSESLNKKFVYWLKKNGWVELTVPRLSIEYDGEIK